MDVIEASVTWDGRWWVADLTVDGREYGTQARSLATMRDMVADAALLMTDRPVSSFSVSLSVTICDASRVRRSGLVSRSATGSTWLTGAT